MKLCLSLVCFFTIFTTGFSSSMTFKDLGITTDINRVATSLNDIFKESFELMTGSLGKHGVYYLPEINEKLDYERNTTKEKQHIVFHAFNGWMQNPALKASKSMTAGALRKYKVSASPSSKEVFLVCIECFEVYAQSVNFCYEATNSAKNSSGTISSGPLTYVLNLQIRVTQQMRSDANNVANCNVTLGDRGFELSKDSELRTEVRGLRSLNFLANSVDGWVTTHLNATVKNLLQERLLSSLNKVMTKHDMCEEFIGQ